MLVMQPPTGPIEISDPSNLPELFINGPFNVINKRVSANGAKRRSYFAAEIK